ncbi:MAG: hypothetical protein ACYDAA_08650 [Syntrophales bacterium]
MIVIKKLSCFRWGLTGLLLLCLLLPMIMGCHSRGDSGGPIPEGKIVFESVAVVPFQQVAPEESASGAVRCPLCGMNIYATRSPGTPEVVVETVFLAQLDKQRPKLSVIAGDRVAGVFRRISTDSLTAPLRQVLKDVGSELGAEGVVAGYVYRFRERKGVSYAVEQPASVAFEIHLLRVSDGALVWRGTFDKEQSSLMADVFQFASFFRGKGKWLTAEELAGEGVEQLLNTFPGLP